MSTAYRWCLGAAVVFTATVALWPFPVVAHHLGTVAVAVGAGAAWLFVALYSTHPWRTWAEGRHLMQFTGGLGLILTLSTAFAFVRPVGVTHPGLELLRLGVMAWLALMLVWRVRLLLNATREHSNGDDRGDLSN